MPLVSTTLAKLVAKFAAGVVDTSGKLAAGIIATGGNIATGIVVTAVAKKKFATSVVGTGGAP